MGDGSMLQFFSERKPFLYFFVFAKFTELQIRVAAVLQSEYDPPVSRTASYVFGCLVNLIQLRAQVASVILQATISDAKGAPIPSAVISVANAATNALRTTASNAKGLYSLELAAGKLCRNCLSPGVLVCEGTSPSSGR